MAEGLNQSNPGDADLIKTIVILNIHLNSFQKALDFIPPDKANLEFEHAYCLYRLEKLEECLEVCQQGEREQKFRVLAAQANFRLGMYEQSASIYEELLGADDNNEYRANLSAALSSNQTNRKVSSNQLLQNSTWEVMYNSAISHSLENDFANALTQLK